MLNYIALASLFPILKQLFVLKFLDYNYLDIYGLLFAIIGILVGLTNLGWSEITAINIAQKKSNKENRNLYYIAICIVLLVNTVFIPFVFIVQEIGFEYTFLACAFVIIASVMQLNNKVARSYDLLKVFFSVTIFKNLFDLLLFGLLSYNDALSLEALLTVEIGTSFFLVVYLWNIKVLKASVFNFNKKRNYKNLKKYYLKHYLHASNILIMSALSLFLAFGDRLLYYHILPREAYIEFLFYAIIINIFLSINALILTLLYTKLSKLQLQSKDRCIKVLDGIFLKLLLTLSLLPFLVYISVNLQLNFYEHVPYSINNTVAAFLYGYLLMFNVYEKYNILSKGRFMKYLQGGALIIFLVMALMMKVYDMANLFNLLVLVIVVRIVYIYMSRKVI